MKRFRPFDSLFQWTPTDRFRWTRGVFLGVDQVGLPTNKLPAEWIDLTGPARILFYGPYFHLPVGAWGANISFAVDKNLSGNMLFAEVISGSKVIVTSTFPLPKTGAFEFTIPFEVTEPRDPVQIRMTILEGAIEGLLSLKDVTIFRMDSDRLLP